MEEHPEFALGHITNLGADGKGTYAKLWKKCADKVNKFGPFREIVGWQNVWIFDYYNFFNNFFFFKKKCFNSFGKKFVESRKQ